MKWRSGLLKIGVLALVIGAISAFCDIHAIWEATLRAGLYTIAAAFVLSIIVIVFNAFKWQLMFQTARVATLFKIYLISSFYAYFFIGQAGGEAAKIYLLSRASGNVSGSVVSVVADRLTSFIGLLIISVIGFALSPSAYPQGLQEISLAGLLLLLALLIALRHDAVIAFAERMAFWLERLTPRLKAVALALRQAIEQWHVSVRNIYRVAAGVALGALIHVGNVLVIMVIARGVGIGANFFDFCWVVGVMSIAGLIPITIGQMTAYGTMVALLQLLGVPLVDAVATSVLIMAVNLVIATTGAFLAWHMIRSTNLMWTWRWRTSR